MLSKFKNVFVLAGLVISPHSSFADDKSPGAAPATCVPGPTSSLAVTLRPQLTGMWCWAASGQMIMEYLGRAIDQCTQVNNELNHSDCCTQPTPDGPNGCVFGGWPQFDKYGFTYKRTHDTPLSWTSIQSELAPRDVSGSCRGTPFTFTWHWYGGGGHTMVAIGYKTVGAVSYVEVNNPLPVDVGNHEFITYDEYVQGTDHYHWDDYYDIQ